jgi:uncharacterized protein with PIN domain
MHLNGGAINGQRILLPGFGRAYWPGTHYERMTEFIRQCTKER